MAVAVVIPLHNGANTIRATLDSVFAQSLIPSEIVVVDDGSTDDSAAVAERYRGVEIIRSSRAGPNVARNVGLSRTSADHVAFLDQDDVWHPDHLRILEDILTERGNCVAAFASVRVIGDGYHAVLPGGRGEIETLNPWKYFPFNRVDTPSCALVRRRALEAGEPWRVRFSGAADFYLWLTLDGTLARHRGTTVGRRVSSRSYSASLRYRDVASLLRDHRAAAETALRESPRLPGKAGDVLQARRELLELIERALLTRGGAPGSRPDVLARLDRRLGREPDHIVRATCETLLWYSFPHLEHTHHAEELDALERLCDEWSHGTRTGCVLRASVIRAVATRNLCRLALRRPMLLARWALLARGAWTSLSQRLSAGRVALAASKPTTHQPRSEDGDTPTLSSQSDATSA